MNNYRVDIRFSVCFFDDEDMVGDGLKRIHQRCQGEIQAKSRHDAYRKFRKVLNLQWPGRFKTEFRHFSIARIS